jgi:exopolysaccharide biosynthesis polyprenyl glycosylphosphotransferase
MFRRFSVNFALFSMGLDAAIVAFALIAASNIRPWLSRLPFTADIPAPMQLPRVLYVVFPITWVAILLLLSAYDGRRNLYVTDEISNLTIGSILAGVSQAGILYLSFREVSRVLYLAFVAITFIAMAGWRMAARLWFRSPNGKLIKQRRVLIVGAGPVGRELQLQILKNAHLGLTVAGFLDDDPDKQHHHKEILGSLATVKSVVGRFDIDDVVIALPRRAHARVSELAAELHDLPVKVWVIPDYFHLALNKAVMEDFAGIPMLDLRAPALNDYQRMIKRLFDLLIILLTLPVTLPMMGLIALLIRLDDPGPVFFRQERVGENGRLFTMLKFRTMVPNAEQLRHLVEHVDEEGHLIHKTQDDPRVTRIGRFLRRTSLDELPQIFNILKGDMSIVGPRPEMPYLVQKYEPWQHKRFAVPQGVTGWWQVNGRSDKPMHLNTEDDLYYIQNYSILLDLYILFKTFWVVLRGKGAY